MYLLITIVISLQSYNKEIIFTPYKTAKACRAAKKEDLKWSDGLDKKVEAYCVKQI